jgi:hypothetical protein
VVQCNLFEPTPDTPPIPVIVTPIPLTLKYEAFYRDGISEHDIRCSFRDAFVSSKQKDHPWYLEQNEFWFWDRIIDQGRSYMVGDMPASQYLRKYSSPLSDWQQKAYKWALANPNDVLFVETKTHHWRVYLRGEYVEFCLPHQDHGGERAYVTRNGKTKVLVNED